MYLNVLESQSIPDTDTLSLIYQPNQARSTVQSPAIEDFTVADDILVVGQTWQNLQ